ncbi:MAG: GNAT family N-acetyltransferase [Pygmaiobacter sp.]|nr:GNAT family N-acetyltransferase [Pygmaiobacter sp.]
MQLILTPPSAQDYIDLRIRADMGGKDLARSTVALQNSLFTVCLYDNDLLVAFGRVVGDGGITYVVSDIMVDKAYRRKGYAERIMQQIDLYFAQHTHEDSYICLIANRPADELYHKHQFDYLPADKTGMLRRQTPQAEGPNKGD